MLVAGLLVSGCTWGDEGQEAAPRPDWVEAETTTDQAGILIEKVVYRSDDLDIDGQVCRPKGDGPHPVLIWNHGGYAGLDDWNKADGFCALAARSGWVLAESSYRGEDGSDGRIEICQGEVDDVLAMLEVVRGQEYVDRQRVAMVGVSHGGCITARAVQRGAPVQVGVDIAGPSDWALLWDHLTTELERPSTSVPAKAIYQDLVVTLEKGVGGTPAQRPEEYASRSPIAEADKIAEADVPFLIMHGLTDTIVPAKQSCDFARAAGAFQAYRFDASGNLATQAPEGCDVLTWRGPPNPMDTFNADRYLFVYDGVDHLLSGTGLTRVTTDFLRFLELKLP